MKNSTDSPLWIFGYGSIIWRVDFPFTEEQPAYIFDWHRRFWQGSTDHRGTPENPGRVVTLISAVGERCYGKAYRIADEDRAKVLAHLDYREKGGYDRLNLRLYLSDHETVAGLTYMATTENENYLGDPGVVAIAEQIRAAKGPSGSNIEYLLQLHQALSEMDIDDDHVSEITALVKDRW